MMFVNLKKYIFKSIKSQFAMKKIKHKTINY